MNLFGTPVITHHYHIMMSLCNYISLRDLQIFSPGCDWIPNKTEGETLDNHHPQDLGHCNDSHHLMINSRSFSDKKLANK